MNAMFFALAVSLSLPTFACKLDSPIDLSGLKFEEGVEFIGNANTFPSLKMIFPETRNSKAEASQLYLTYPIDNEFRNGTLTELVLGARVDLEESDFGLGLWDQYDKKSLERNIEKTADGEIHTIKAYDTYYENVQKVPYVSEMSIVKIQNNQIVSVEVGMGVVTRDRYPNPKKVGMKKTCVTSVSM